MSKTGRPNYRRGPRGTRKAERHITVRGVRRDPPDLRMLSRAVITMALRDTEAQAEAHAAMNGNGAPGSGQASVPANGDDAEDTNV